MLEQAQGVSLVELCRIVLDLTGAWPEVEALGDDLLKEDRGADQLDTARVGGEDAVAMLTVHRAKGLEWPTVFLPALCHNTFPSPGNPYADPVDHPQFLPYDRRLDAAYLPDLPSNVKARKALIKAHHADQEWRTAYVAVTRAAGQIVATGAFWYTEKSTKTPSRIFELAVGSKGVEIVEDISDPGEPPETLRFPSDPADGPDPLFPDGWRTALRTAVDDPGWPARFAAEQGIGTGYNEAVGQLSMVLDDLPAIHDQAGEPRAFRTSVTGLVTFASPGASTGAKSIDSRAAPPLPCATASRCTGASNSITAAPFLSKTPSPGSTTWSPPGRAGSARSRHSWTAGSPRSARCCWKPHSN